MKLRFSSSFQANLALWITAFIDWLLLLPLWLALQTYLQSGEAAVRWIYLLPLLVAGGVLLRHRCSRLWQQLLAALLLGLLTGLISSTLTLLGIPLVAGAAVCAYLGMTTASRVNRFRIYLAGITIYFIGSIAFSQIPELQANVTILTWSGSLCLVLALIDSNSSHLRYSSLNSDSARLPEGLRRHNRLYLAGFIVLAAVLAAGGGKTVGMLLWNAVRLFFTWLSRLSSGAEEPPPEEAPPQAIQEFPAAEAGEPGILAAILNIGFYIIGAAAIVVVLYYGVRWLYRNTGGLLRRAMDWLLTVLRRESPAAAAGYQDEETSLFTWEQTVQGFRDYFRTRLTPSSRRDRWETMDGSRARIRWLYRHWLRAKHTDGYEVKAYLTPQETAADVAAWSEGQKRQRKNPVSEGEAYNRLLAFYNRARYADEEQSDLTELSAEEITALKEQLKL
ncbi:hypothetical protein P40081_17575 [Paenibacillus sp. FSL P4-0081]|uniref:hypothetical protein n=1 Tax=Paenibacillus sp. FSL P4-0081 TaxID=1536769 RepID=UPI0004F75932|nr:hypothetical protein [Paenibacillus sp. FSL P4-0081]AIQ29767.1 hypothetical protein P40081_17575 [Paenibacillus sp. FSL P4-0081]